MTLVEDALAPLTFGREAIRKTLHTVTAVVPFAYSRGLLSRDAVIVMLGTAVALALLVEWGRRVSSRARLWFECAFGALLRGRERSAVTGATWLLGSCLAAVVLLPQYAAVAALWCAAAGDPAATLAGRTLGARRGRKIGNAKTVTGSAACFLTSLAGVWMLTHFSIEAAALVASVATIAEFIPSSLDDNVRVVTTAGVTAWLLS